MARSALERGCVNSGRCGRRRRLEGCKRRARHGRWRGADDGGSRCRSRGRGSWPCGRRARAAATGTRVSAVARTMGKSGSYGGCHWRG
ncbi:Os02g0278501 [Oryza sativa Japonica Group]|uniref:Os02g0278501 protein n=1 Tax=Oryza sativa subsp. japonica TaxID=39947 RepID=A0A0N7KF34_ORYSJ|nr:Os02g0278501 [Oryza sativa Japonica Group]